MLIEILLISTIILLFALILGAFFIYQRLNKKVEAKPEDDKAMLMLQSQISELNKVFDFKLGDINKELNRNLLSSQDSLRKQYEHNSKIYQDITQKLTKLEGTNSQIMDFSKQLQDLQDILKNPKQRGILGEFYLSTILENILPPNSYSLQYKIGQDKDGKDLIVDAAIFMQNKIVPIDSKFSLENYEKLIKLKEDTEQRKTFEQKFKQDLKNRIDETAKYIRPDLGTMDFAFMFIPAEAVYYDLLINKVGAIKTTTTDLIEYAMRQKKVILVSPTSFLAYLQTVLQGLRALQIEESAKDIRKHVEQLHKHVIQYDTFMQKLGKNLDSSVNAYNESYKELNKVEKDLLKIGTDEQKEIEPLLIEKTNIE